MRDRTTTKVLLVEDSATVAAYVVSLLVAEPDMQMLPVARTAQEGVRVALAERPDVVLMDIQLPDQDGLWAIEQIMADKPCPVVVLSGYLSLRERNITFESLRAGAVDVLAKPQGLSPAVREAFRENLVRTVRLMASAVVVRRGRRTPPAATHAPLHVQQLVTQADLSRVRRVLVGASTGGPELLHRMLSELPAPLPYGVLVTQHTLEGFDESLAQWLGGTGHRVQVAREGDDVRPGDVLLSPATRHVRVTSRGLALQPMTGSEAVASIDTMFESGAAAWGQEALGVLLTGMGKDGAAGLKALHDVGAWTVAQTADSCVVASMPESARVRGGVRQSLAPPDIIELLRQLARLRGQPPGHARKEG